MMSPGLNTLGAIIGDNHIRASATVHLQVAASTRGGRRWPASVQHMDCSNYYGLLVTLWSHFFSFGSPVFPLSTLFFSFSVSFCSQTTSEY